MGGIESQLRSLTDLMRSLHGARPPADKDRRHNNNNGNDGSGGSSSSHFRPIGSSSRQYTAHKHGGGGGRTCVCVMAESVRGRSVPKHRAPSDSDLLPPTSHVKLRVLKRKSTRSVYTRADSKP